jgi:hypothetical protein
MMALYFGIGFAVPFFIVRHHCLGNKSVLIHPFNSYEECFRRGSIFGKVD